MQQHGRFTIVGGRLIETRAAKGTLEQRARVGEVRAIDPGGKPGVSLHLIRPRVVDDWGSLWMPNTFDESLGIRMPTLCWAHDWGEPLGHGIDYRTGTDGPEVDFLFDDFEAVPMARRAHAQVASGTISDCSVGFSNTERRDPTDAERREFIGIREVILKATCDETSLVLRGAVPGAVVTGYRTAAGAVATVSEDLVVNLAKRVVAGELTQDEAAVALALAASPEAPATGTGEGGDAKTPEELAAEAAAAVALETEAAEALEAALEESDEALAVLDGRSR